MPIVAPLVALDVLVLCLWAIAVALAIAVVMKHVGKVLGGIPAIGGALSGAMNAVAQVITNAAGTLEKGVDHLIGAAWHQLARYTDKLWSELVAHSTALVQLAQLVGHLVHSVHGLRAIVRALEHAGHGVTAAVKTLEREYKGIEHRVRVLERDIAAGIGHDLRIRIKALERWEKSAEHTIDTTIPNAIAGVEGDVTALKDWLGAKINTNFRDWTVGVLLTALAAIGLSGLVSKCNPLRRQSDPCAWWNGLDSLLGLATATLLALEFETLIKEMQTLEHDVTVAAKDVFGIG